MENELTSSKKIEIIGQTNRYLIKKLIKPPKEENDKKRVITKKWELSNECYTYTFSIQLLHTIIKNNYTFNDSISKIAIQEINKKINSYKQQDILKKHLNTEKLIDFHFTMNKMIENELKCYYCNCEMVILYDNTRELKQWTIDRIDNDIGHNKDNVHLSCLDCNLKKRKRSDSKFLFTKQLIIMKENTCENKNNENIGI
jgi:hypothetical protein